ncbi:MAG: tRNA 4-thiouridine(8) synthase ThiI [Firmicutes bacterium]|nr:tRNA 4-thiouridine(8) synthase ThiI [Bacillota bacterium]
MSKSIILIRYGEIHLKGNNRGFFLKLLSRNIRSATQDFGCRLEINGTRYEIVDFDEAVGDKIIDRLKIISGITSVSKAIKIPSDFDVLKKTALDHAPKNKQATFRITVNRADKTYKYNSNYIASELGAYILSKRAKLRVDLHNADTDIKVDIREDGSAYVFCEVIGCAGGMPVGSAGRGLLLLSGGLDSPVAGYLMTKRGMSLDAIHFHSYPYTGEEAQKKVEELATTLGGFCGGVNLTSVSVTHIQEAIHKFCLPDYMICLLRRYMIRIAEKVAIERGCQCLITGESLGQVASQTVESITMTNAVADKLPILRPLIATNKSEIIDIARQIGTYDISIRPYEDCCTVFLPKHPIIKPRLDNVLREEAKLGDILGDGK